MKDNIKRSVKGFKFTYITLVVLSLVISAYIVGNPSFKDFILQMGSFEYLGAILAGVLFVFSFTVPISIVLITILANDINPLALGLIGGIGAVMGDLIIFKLIKHHLADELALLFPSKEISYYKHIFRSKYVSWTLPILGILVIASPLPDELGVSLLGLSKMSDTQFIAISFVSNSLGILMIASVAKVF